MTNKSEKTYRLKISGMRGILFVLLFGLSAPLSAQNMPAAAPQMQTEQNPAPQGGQPTPQDVKSAAGVLPKPYALSRQDEDYRYLRDPASHKDWWNPLKYISLNRSGSQYLTLGGEVRERYEYYNHLGFGQAPQDDGYLLQRYMFHADLHLGDRTRFFVQFKSGLVAGNRYAPHPPDEDDLDTHQLFGDFTLLRRTAPDSTPNEELTLRAGRQELSFGSNRLVTTREGPNVRQSFDGVRVWHTGRRLA